MAKLVQGREGSQFIDQATSPISLISPPTGLTGYFNLGEALKQAEKLKSSVSVRSGEIGEMGEMANGPVHTEVRK